MIIFAADSLNMGFKVCWPPKFIQSRPMSNEDFQAKLMKIQDNLLNFAYMLTANREDAYDLLQDTTLRVLDSQEKYMDNANFKGWVFTIMRNIFINNYRKAGRTSAIIDSTDTLFPVSFLQESDLETPEGSYSAAEIIQTIQTFPDQYRIPFSMHIAGYRYGEISRVLGLPLGTIKSRIFIARKRLQKQFKDYR